MKELIPKRRFTGFTGPWEHRKVGDYYDFKNGLNKGKEYFGQGTPIVNFTDVFHNRGIYHKNINGKVSLEPSEIRNYEVKKGDIFFTRTSETIEEIGYPSVMLDIPKDTVFSGFVLRGRTKLNEDPLDNLFKKYVFFTDVFRTEMIKKSSMTTRALTSGTAIKNMTFMYPESKKEQSRIGAFFSSLDNLITLHQRKLKKLKESKAAYLSEMFPKEGEVYPKRRFAGFTDPWEQCKLKDIGSFKNGMNFSKEAMGIGFPFVNLQNIFGRNEINTNNLGLAEASQSQLKDYNLLKGDVLFVRSSVKLEGVGEAALVPKNLENTTYSGFIIRFRDEKGLDYNFKRHIFTTSSVRKQIISQATDSANKNISQPVLENLNFGVPVKEEQVKIGEFFVQLDNLITLHQRKLEKLQALKQAYLSEMFI